MTFRPEFLLAAALALPASLAQADSGQMAAVLLDRGVTLVSAGSIESSSGRHEAAGVEIEFAGIGLSAERIVLVEGTEGMSVSAEGLSYSAPGFVLEAGSLSVSQLEARSGAVSGWRRAVASGVAVSWLGVPVLSEGRFSSEPLRSGGGYGFTVTGNVPFLGVSAVLPPVAWSHATRDVSPSRRLKADAWFSTEGGGGGAGLSIETGYFGKLEARAHGQAGFDGLLGLSSALARSRVGSVDLTLSGMEWLGSAMDAMDRADGADDRQARLMETASGLAAAFARWSGVGDEGRQDAERAVLEFLSRPDTLSLRLEGPRPVGLSEAAEGLPDGTKASWDASGP